MRLWVPIFFFILMIFHSTNFASAADADLLKTEEQMHLDAIKNEPTSERQRFGYIMFLFSHERYDEIEPQLKVYEKLDPKNGMPSYLRAHLPELKAAKTENERRQIVGRILPEMIDLETKEASEQLEKFSSPHVLEDARAETTRRQEEIDSKFHIRSNRKYRRTPEELQRSGLAQEMMSKKQFDKAEQTLKDQIIKYPESDYARVDWIAFLIERERYHDAWKAWAEAKHKLPDSGRILSLEDPVKNIMKAPSSEKRERAALTFKMYIMDLMMLDMTADRGPR